MVTKALLEGSLKGVGKFHKTPIFPCGIFQYKQGVNDKPGTPNYDLKKLAIKSTVRRLYPNYANCDWSVNDSAIDYDRVTKREIIRNIRDNDKDTYDKLVKLFGLNPQKRLNGFSKGMQRQAELVLAMATNPDFLLLDESFDGLDPQKRQIIKNLVTEYAKDRGAHVIISSHNLHDLGDMCDRFGLINGKRLVLDHDMSDLGDDFTKYRMAFSEGEDKTEEDFSLVPLSKFNKDGRLITITVKGEREKAEALIKAMGPVYLEQFPMTMEEIFLEEVEGVDYDFSQIFK